MVKLQTKTKIYNILKDTIYSLDVNCVIYHNNLGWVGRVLTNEYTFERYIHICNTDISLDRLQKIATELDKILNNKEDWINIEV